MGYYLFKFIGDQMQTFLFFTDSGVKLVFGDKFEQHFIAFKVQAKYKQIPFELIKYFT